MPVTRPHENFIGGEWVAAPGYAPNVNPSDLSDIVGEYAQSGPADVEAAIQAADGARRSWAVTGIQSRADALEFVAAEILARRQELGSLLAREEGKTLPEAIGEVVRAGNIFRFFAGECLRGRSQKIDSVRSGVEIDVTREPVGTVGLITPWNFPMAIPAWKIAPALAFGNAVVWKPADLVPGCAWALAEIISRSGVPKGAFNLVMGRGRIVGEAIIGDRRIHAVSFTGSQAVGQQIASAAAARLCRVQLEMGGKNPQVVLDDADLAVAVELSAQSAFFSTGQRCTASSRLIVTQGIHDRFVAALTDRVRQLKVGDAREPGVDLGPVVSDAQLTDDLRYIATGVTEGGRLATGGERLTRATDGYYLAPALFTETTPAMTLNREEVFGPVATVIKVKDYDEALAVANDTPFGLSAGIATTSLKHATHFKRHAEAGLVMVNLPTAGVDYHIPFGGRKGSSYGPREQGSDAVEFYTVGKTAYTRA